MVFPLTVQAAPATPVPKDIPSKSNVPLEMVYGVPPALRAVPPMKFPVTVCPPPVNIPIT